MIGIFQVVIGPRGHESFPIFWDDSSPPGTVAIMVQRNSRLKLLFHMYKSEESHWPAKNGVDNRGDFFQQQLHLIYIIYIYLLILHSLSMCMYDDPCCFGSWFMKSLIPTTHFHGVSWLVACLLACYTKVTILLQGGLNGAITLISTVISPQLPMYFRSFLGVTWMSQKVSKCLGSTGCFPYW